MKPSTVILQPGQIWTPLPGSQQQPARQIIDLPEGMVSYQTLMVSSRNIRGEQYLVRQSLFRRWIKLHKAVLYAHMETKVSPAAELAEKLLAYAEALA